MRWCDLFATICWLIWRRRNEFIFQDKIYNNDSTIIHAKSLLMSLEQARKKMVGVNLNGNGVQVQKMCWKPLNPGWVKLNVDGACTQRGVMGCGSLLRAADGQFVIGFIHHIPEPGDSLQAELWGVLLGLRMTWEHGDRQVVLETDASDVVRLVNSQCIEMHPDANLIREIQFMLARDWEVSVQQIAREANSCADFLAKYSLQSMPGYLQFNKPAEKLVMLVQDDQSALDLLDPD